MFSLNVVEDRGEAEDGLEKREPAGLLGLASGLVDPAPADVPHPFDHIVVTVVQLWLKDFQVAHLQPRGRKWDLLRERKVAESVEAEGQDALHTQMPEDPGLSSRNGHQELLFPSFLLAGVVTDSSGSKDNPLPLALPPGWPHVSLAQGAFQPVQFP